MLEETVAVRNAGFLAVLTHDGLRVILQVVGVNDDWVSGLLTGAFQVCDERQLLGKSKIQL